MNKTAEMNNEACQKILQLCEELREEAKKKVHKKEALIRWALYEIEIQTEKINKALED